MLVCSEIGVVGSGQFGLSSVFDCHVYAVRGLTGIVLIDAGSGRGEDAILSHVAMDFPVSSICAILLTHAHADHAAGASALCARLGCELICGQSTAEIIERGDEERNGLSRARNAGVYPSDLRMIATKVSRRLDHAERFEVAGIAFEAIHVRGHSDDSFCFIASIGGRRALFAGDVVFYGGILGVINAPDSGMQGYCAELSRLREQRIDSLFPAHGLFTLSNGQRHIDAAIESCSRGFLSRQIGQGDLIF